MIFEFVARHRRACAGAAIALTGAEIAGSQLYPTAAFGTLAVVGGAALLGGIARVRALGRRPPAALRAGPGTLASPRYGTEQIWWLAGLQLAGIAAAATVTGAVPVGLGVLGCVLAAGLVAAVARALPRGWGGSPCAVTASRPTRRAGSCSCPGRRWPAASPIRASGRGC